MQVSNAVRVSCRGALSTRFCAWETISGICLKFYFVSFALPVSKSKLLHPFLKYPCSFPPNSHLH